MALERECPFICTNGRSCSSLCTASISCCTEHSTVSRSKLPTSSSLLIGLRLRRIRSSWWRDWKVLREWKVALSASFSHAFCWCAAGLCHERMWVGKTRPVRFVVSALWRRRSSSRRCCSFSAHSSSSCHRCRSSYRGRCSSSPHCHSSLSSRLGSSISQCSLITVYCEIPSGQVREAESRRVQSVY